MPRARAAAITAASRGTPGDFDDRARVGEERQAVGAQVRVDVARQLGGRARVDADAPRSPRAASARAAAMPERARPTTSHGPGGSGGTRFHSAQAT